MKKQVISILLASMMVLGSASFAAADEQSNLEQYLQEHKEALSSTEASLQEMATRREAIQSEISTMNADLVDLMVEINQAEDDIVSAKSRIEETAKSINDTAQNLSAAEVDRDSQYEDMKKRIQYIYENGGSTGWAVMVLESEDITTLLNKAEYAMEIEETDQAALTTLKNTVEEISTLKTSLEEKQEKQKEQKSTLEAQKTALDEDKVTLDQQIEEKKAADADFSYQIEVAQAQADELSDIIRGENERIAEIQAEKEAAAAEAARIAAAEAERAEQEREAAIREQEEEHSSYEEESAGEEEAYTAGASEEESSDEEDEEDSDDEESSYDEDSSDEDESGDSYEEGEESAYTVGDYDEDYDDYDEDDDSYEGSSDDEEYEYYDSYEETSYEAGYDGYDDDYDDYDEYDEDYDSYAEKSYDEDSYDEDSYDEDSYDGDSYYDEDSDDEDYDSYDEDYDDDYDEDYDDEDYDDEESSSGSGSGEFIVDYARQFVGGPYVYGGNSLTSGCDCSHFVYLVLSNCGAYDGGYMTSGDWAGAGSSVGSLSNAQAGDVIVYSGHVAIYDGNGCIVEAQSSSTGITDYRSASYKSIVSIRRFV